MALVGNLRDFGLPDFLYLVDRGAKTGRLALQHDDEQAFLYFQNGKLVYASRNAAEERLGELLVRAGRVTPEQRNYALHLQRTTQQPKPLGLIMVELGYVNREGIIRTVRSQIEETVYRLFAWHEGEFRFEPDVPPPRESVSIPLSIENVIMEGVRRIDEWARIRDQIPGPDVIVRFAALPAARARSINLTPEEWRVFSRINGAENLAGIVRLTGLSEFEVSRIVYGFLQAGLVEVARPVLQPAGMVQVAAVAPAAGPPPVAAPVPIAPFNGRAAAPSARPTPAPQPFVPPKRGLIYRIIERIRRL